MVEFMTWHEAYCKLMNTLDDVALGNRSYEESVETISDITKRFGFTPQDVGDANDAYGICWPEVIDNLKENFKKGERVSCR